MPCQPNGTPEQSFPLIHRTTTIFAYADLSDFFYVWLRRSLKSIYPELFATVLVPKADELVAIPYRHGGKQQGGGILSQRA